MMVSRVHFSLFPLNFHVGYDAYDDTPGFSTLLGVIAVFITVDGIMCLQNWEEQEGGIFLRTILVTSKGIQLLDCVIVSW